MWLLGLELGTSRRAVIALLLSAIPPSSKWLFSQCFNHNDRKEVRTGVLCLKGNSGSHILTSPCMVLTKVLLCSYVHCPHMKLHMEVHQSPVFPDACTQHVSRAGAGAPVSCKQAASQPSVRASAGFCPGTCLPEAQTHPLQSRLASVFLHCLRRERDLPPLAPGTLPCLALHCDGSGLLVHSLSPGLGSHICLQWVLYFFD